MPTPSWMLPTRGRIDARHTLAKTGKDFIKANGGLAPSYAQSFGGLNEFYENQVTPSANEKLQQQAAAEQSAAGGFFGRGTTAAQQAQENEEVRQSGSSFATPPPSFVAPRNRQGGFNEGQEAKDSAGNTWTWLNGKSEMTASKAYGPLGDFNKVVNPNNAVGGSVPADVPPVEDVQASNLSSPTGDRSSNIFNPMMGVPDKVGQIVNMPAQPPGIHFAAPPAGPQPPAAGFPAPQASNYAPSGTLNTDFYNRGIKREMRADPRFAYGVMKTEQHEAQAQSNAEAEAKRWQVTQDNITTRAEKTRNQTKQIADDNRTAADRRAKETREFQVQQEQQKVAQKAIEKEKESKVKTAAEQLGQVGRIGAMVEVGYLDEKTANFIKDQPPELQKGYLDLIEKHRKDTPEETTIKQVGDYTIKEGPGTIVKEGKDPNSMTLRERKNDYYRLLELRSKYADDPEAVKDIDADIAEARQFIRGGAKPGGSPAPAAKAEPEMTVMQRLQKAKEGIKISE